MCSKKAYEILFTNCKRVGTRTRGWVGERESERSGSEPGRLNQLRPVDQIIKFEWTCMSLGLSAIQHGVDIPSGKKKLF